MLRAQINLDIFKWGLRLGRVLGLIIDATKRHGPGGKRITPEERDQILMAVLGEVDDILHEEGILTQ